LLETSKNDWALRVLRNVDGRVGSQRQSVLRQLTSNFCKISEKSLLLIGVSVEASDNYGPF